jgi:non-lysosomal glucosylceramidase
MTRSPELDRRRFIAAGGLGLAGLAWSCSSDRLSSSGAPASANDSSSKGSRANEVAESLVPADKHLDPEWIRSLFARGEPTVYRSTKQELDWIGMPIGGICAGQLYLGGDGKLWHWDIFNTEQAREWSDGNGPLYAHPAKPSSPLEQGFALRVKSSRGESIRKLDRTGFDDISFRGQYPITFVEYRDAKSPVSVDLEAFSPFIPLDPEDSGLPATVLRYTVKNATQESLEVAMAGWMQNIICRESGQPGLGRRVNSVLGSAGQAWLWCDAQVTASPAGRSDNRPDIVFDDFESEKYEGWTAVGTAFGEGPTEIKKMPAYQGDVNGHGDRVVNTHNARHGENVGQADAHTGTLTSRTFTIERDFITFRIGGGSHKGRTCMNLIVDGAVVRSATGRDDNRMHLESFDVRDLARKTAVLQIVDEERGGWGHIAIDEIVFADEPRGEMPVLSNQPDFGSIALVLLDGSYQGFGQPEVSVAGLPGSAFGNSTETLLATEFGKKPVGSIAATAILAPGASFDFTFVLAWCFPNLPPEAFRALVDPKPLRRSYAKRFKSAPEVANYVSNNIDRLATATRLWHASWYDSTLPWWFLERTFLNTSIAASATCYRFDNERFYANEGTYCCAGTCTHVWQYAQALARVFPELERSTREMVDFGLAFHDDTDIIDYRGEYGRQLAIDGQAGTILRALREHQMSADDAFLKKSWPRIKKALELLIARDKKQRGILDGEQYNTLDASWYGEIAWTSSLYLAALRAGEAMAAAMGDTEFATKTRVLAERGAKSMVERLYDGEYFIQVIDPDHPEATNTNKGCHIDQVFGQSYAHQLGLPHILPADETRSALRSLWKYNFAPDVGAYRTSFKAIQGGRWYAMPGESGLLMCTWPKGGADAAAGKNQNGGFVAYFNECMSGFEYQVAAHMIAEGLVQEGLAIVRAIHDRYHASRRNPWNEIECSNHYARAMASYGAFITICGYEYDGPRGHLGFAPKLGADDFKAAFTAAEGWGSFRQTRSRDAQRERIEVASGRLRLRTLSFALVEGHTAARVRVIAAGAAAAVAFAQDRGRVHLTLPTDLVLQTGQAIEIEIS